MYSNICNCNFQVDTDSIGYTSSKTSIRGKETVRPMSRKDIFYSGSVLNLPEYRSQKSLASYRQSILSLPKSMMKDNDKDDDEEIDGLFDINYIVIIRLEHGLSVNCNVLLQKVAVRFYQNLSTLCCLQ